MVQSNKYDFSSERGAVMIVEAALVYPIVIFVVIVFLVLGNMFYQQSRVDSAVLRAAEKMAAYYTDPTLIDGGIPTNAENMDVYPYRYLIGDAGASSAASKFLQEELNSMGSGLFSGMDVNATVKTCEIDNYVVYQTASVQVDYTIDFFPMELLGGVTLFKQTVATTTSVSDPAEFIRNVDMILDYAEENDWLEKLKSTVSKFTGN